MKIAAPPTPVPTISAPVIDTSSLRQFLINGMQDVMKGSITTWQAKAACNFAQQIYNVTALEVKVALAQEKLNGRPIQAVAFHPGPANPVDVGLSTPIREQLPISPRRKNRSV